MNQFDMRKALQLAWILPHGKLETRTKLYLASDIKSFIMLMKEMRK